jgi:hypothetical protein
MILSLGVLGFVFRMPTGGALAWLAVITLMVYVESFAISLGPIFWLLIAEIYPLRVRGIAEGAAAGVNWAFNFLISLTFLTLVEVLGPSTFWVYALLAIAAWLFSYYLVPETKGHTLEESELRSADATPPNQWTLKRFVLFLAGQGRCSKTSARTVPNRRVALANSLATARAAECA